MNSILQERPISSHWGDDYPDRGNIMLARFEGSNDVFLCRVKSSDELGGNLVELTLQRVNLMTSELKEETISFDLWRSPESCNIRGWENISNMKEEEWKTLLDLGRKLILWKNIQSKLPPIS